jgi:hypothetical protein
MELLNEWDLPPSDRIEEIRLWAGELLLIDWVICTQSQLLQIDIDDLVQNWHAFRQSVWEAYLSDPDNVDNPSGVMFSLSDSEAKVLLAAVPTTFRWGDGFDYGCSLKGKLARLLNSTYTDPVLTDKVEAEAHAKELAKAAAANNLTVTNQNYITSIKSAELSKNTLQAKMKEATRIKNDTVKQAKEAAKVDLLKVSSLREDLVKAIQEAREHGIDTYEAENQTESAPEATD